MKFSYAHTKTIRKKYHALTDNNNIVMLSRRNADERTRLSRSRLTQIVSAMYICIGTMGHANHSSNLIVSLVAFSRVRGAVCRATRSSQWLDCRARVRRCPIEMTKWQSDALERPTYSWRHLIFRFSHVARVRFQWRLNSMVVRPNSLLDRALRGGTSTKRRCPFIGIGTVFFRYSQATLPRKESMYH